MPGYSRNDAGESVTAPRATGRTIHPETRPMPDTDDSDEELLRAARSAMAEAYAPYSEFRVGAALETDDGRRFAGCNVENASYPVGMCAEQAALGAAISAGARNFRRIGLVSSGPRPVPPCGRCRQALAEFGTELEVVSEGTDGSRRRWSLADLLPDSFDLDSAGRSAG